MDRHLQSTADTRGSDALDRRKLIKLGAAGAAVAGAATVGGPQVLGLGTSPAYAAGTSGSGTTTQPPALGSIAVTLNLWDGTDPALRPVFPFDFPSDPNQHEFANLYTSASRQGSPVASVEARGLAGNNFIAFTFADVAPGTYYVDVQEPFHALGAAGTTIGALFVTIDWNVDYEWNPPGPVDEFQQVVVPPGGGTVPLNVDIQVRATIN